MNDEYILELEKRIAALEKTLKEQQEIINKLINLNTNEKVPNIKHPSLFDGTMLCNNSLINPNCADLI